MILQVRLWIRYRRHRYPFHHLSLGWSILLSLSFWRVIGRVQFQHRQVCSQGLAFERLILFWSSWVAFKSHHCSKLWSYQVLSEFPWRNWQHFVLSPLLSPRFRYKCYSDFRAHWCLSPKELGSPKSTGIVPETYFRSHLNYSAFLEPSPSNC